jgi:hypothetical protein
MSIPRTTIHTFTLNEKYELRYGDGTKRVVTFRGTRAADPGPGTIFIVEESGVRTEHPTLEAAFGAYVSKRTLP